MRKKERCGTDIRRKYRDEKKKTDQEERGQV